MRLPHLPVSKEEAVSLERPIHLERRSHVPRFVPSPHTLTARSQKPS